MTTSTTKCPDCGNRVTHAETMTDLTVITSRPAQITIYHCPDCGQVWQVVKQPTKKGS